MAVVLYNKESGEPEIFTVEHFESFINSGSHVLTLEELENGVQEEVKELREEEPGENEKLFENLRKEAKGKKIKGWHKAKGVDALKEMIERYDNKD